MKFITVIASVVTFAVAVEHNPGIANKAFIPPHPEPLPPPAHPEPLPPPAHPEPVPAPAGHPDTPGIPGGDSDPPPRLIPQDGPDPEPVDTPSDEPGSEPAGEGNDNGRDDDDDNNNNSKVGDLHKTLFDVAKSAAEQATALLSDDISATTTHSLAVPTNGLVPDGSHSSTTVDDVSRPTSSTVDSAAVPTAGVLVGLGAVLGGGAILVNW